MGRDKLLLEVAGRTLPQRVADALSERCDEVILVGGDPGLVADARPVRDERPGAEGPLAGMETGLAAAGHPLVFVAAGDMPHLEVGLIRHLLHRLIERDSLAVVPRYAGREHPLCAAYRRETLPYVRSALDDGVRSVRAFLRGLDGVEYLDEGELRRFGDPTLSLMNVNSPGDLERARLAAGR